jgi:diguanylate cyclase (GGDEF)-like protein
MQVLAMTDELTNVPNRRAVLLALGTILQQRDAAICAMLIVDIDHFKTINDQFGHPVGDEILKQVAQQLRHAATAPACVGRMGGEEFVMILPDASYEMATTAAEGFRAAVAALDLSSWLGSRSVTVSIGVTLSMPGIDTSSNMLRRADAALYAAKNAGRNCVKYQPPPSTHASDGADISDAALLIAERQAS